MTSISNYTPWWGSGKALSLTRFDPQICAPPRLGHLPDSAHISAKLTETACEGIKAAVIWLGSNARNVAESIYHSGDLRALHEHTVVVCLHPGKHCLFVNSSTDSVQIFAITSRLVAPSYDEYNTCLI